MKIAILETGHFQYALTQSAIFSDCEKIFIAPQSVKRDMKAYAPELCVGEFIEIKSITENEQEIINVLQSSNIDLLLISPVFDSYKSLNNIVKKIKCKKVITTHNVNTWFYGRFWSPNSYLDRVNMRSIIKNCDYVAVEDFIYNHLKSTNDKIYQKYNCLYIPFTIFHECKERKHVKIGNQLKVVLTGAIDGDRRRYEEVLELIQFLAHRNSEIIFSFAGRALGNYGKSIQKKLEEIRVAYPNLVSYFDDNSTAEMFKQEMETSDLVLSTSTKTFKGMGTLEYIGKTKPTAAIHDMMSYELPGLLPAHLKVPHNLRGSVFNYQTVDDLKKILVNLLDNPSILMQWKAKAKENSLNFTAKEIRKGLPF